MPSSWTMPAALSESTGWDERRLSASIRKFAQVHAAEELRIPVVLDKYGMAQKRSSGRKTRWMVPAHNEVREFLLLLRSSMQLEASEAMQLSFGQKGTILPLRTPMAEVMERCGEVTPSGVSFVRCHIVAENTFGATI